MKNILLVIEDRRLHYEIKNILSFYTFHIISAYSIWESIRLVQEQYPDFIITDLDVLSNNGYKILRTFRQLTFSSKTPILILSDQNKRNFYLKNLQLGIYLFLPKKISMDNLIQVIYQETQSRI